MKTALIIGGGFAGCSSAHMLQKMGSWDVTLVDPAPHLGGGCKTLYYAGHPYTFGPRHFLTQNEKVWEYFEQQIPMRKCAEHIFLTYVEQDQAFYNYPIHMDDVRSMPDWPKIEGELEKSKLNAGKLQPSDFEEFWVQSIGQTLYDKFVNTYSKKMWMVDDNKQIDDFSWSPKGVTLKEGERAAWDTAISAYPTAWNGYDDYFDLATAEATVLLGTKAEHYDIPNKKAVINGEERTFDVIINTIPPDTLFDFCHGELPFIGRDFHKFVLPIAHAFPEDVYFLYYANDEAFTRLVEYKQLTRQNWDSPTTVIGMEIPSNKGRLYPLPFKSEYARAQKYFDEMPDGVFSIGRAGSYQYRFDIDDCIAQSMDIAEQLKS